MDNLASLFNTSIRINNNHPLDKDAVWPKNQEICITRIPIRKRDGWDADQFTEFAKKLKNHMVPNGIVFLICYAPIEAKFRPFEVAKIMVDQGFAHIDNIVVKKTWYPGKRSETNLVNSHEYVLHFCNGNVWKLDRLPIRQYLDIQEDISCPGNTWEIETGSLDESYPVELAELLVRMTNCLPGSVIFDPYCGGTGSLRAAMKLGHTFYGFEQDPKQLKKYEKLVKEFEKENEVKHVSKAKKTAPKPATSKKK
jgi:DNA modification methylase